MHKYVLISGSHSRHEVILDSKGNPRKDSKGKVQTHIVRYDWSDPEHNTIMLSRVQHGSGDMQSRVKLFDEFEHDKGEDPGTMTEAEIVKHVKDLDEEDLDNLLTREEKGKNRTGVTKTILKTLDDLEGD